MKQWLERLFLGWIWRQIRAKIDAWVSSRTTPAKPPIVPKERQKKIYRSPKDEGNQ
jgi:hypothetical protein